MNERWVVESVKSEKTLDTTCRPLKTMSVLNRVKNWLELRITSKKISVEDLREDYLFSSECQDDRQILFLQLPLPVPTQTSIHVHLWLHTKYNHTCVCVQKFLHFCIIILILKKLHLRLPTKEFFWKLHGN